jgi:parvulin-like peptidyl-prolyl isomerase
MATKKTTKKTTKAAPAKVAPKTVAAAKTTPSKKSTRKAAPKTTVKSTTPLAKTEATTTSKTTTEPTRIKKSYVALVIVILLLGVGLYYFRGLFVAAVVNGQPISRLEVIHQTEQQSGKATLDTLVRNALIEQEAKKQNVTVSDKEVSDEITKLQNNLKTQGQSMDQVLAAQGMTKDDLTRLIRLDKLVSKMVGKNVKVSDKEVSDYIDKNKDSLPSSDEATLKKQVKAQLTQQKTNDAVRTWLADLQKKANIVYFVSY